VEQQAVETTVYSLAASAPRQPDRRESDRYLSLLRVGAISVEGQRELCLIRNVSAGGMMIRAYSAIVVGTRLSVELKQGDPVTGTVRWVEDGLTGVAFDAPIDLVQLLSAPGDGPRPRLPRIEVECRGWVRQDGDVVRARITNISQGGIRMECDAMLTIGADVVVTLPGMAPAAGVLKWSDGEIYGVAFNRALVLSTLVQWLKDQQNEQRRSAA
jgi:hypothetical protein